MLCPVFLLIPGFAVGFIEGLCLLVGSDILRKGTGIIMKIVDITPCYRITLENGSYGMETYIDADSKLQITFEDGNT